LLIWPVLKTWFITGTDTGAGKTVVTALLARHLHTRGLAVAALKPVCSGGRADARLLHDALDGALTLDEINPWHFRAPIAPLLAARREQQSVTLAAVRRHIRAMQNRSDFLLVEGAGGLLSPLGEKFNSRDLIAALRAIPVIVAPNQLGVVNQILLTLAALPSAAAATARVVLVAPARPDTATRSNAGLLAEFFPVEQICHLPWLGREFSVAAVAQRPKVRRTLDQVLGLAP